MKPEIQRCDPSDLILQLKGLGIKNILNFDYISPPSLDGIKASLAKLNMLGALDSQSNLTKDGEIMVQTNLDPSFMRAIIVANQEDKRVASEIITIAALMQVSQQLHVTAGVDPFQVSKAKKKQGVIEGDHITFLNIFNKYC